MHNPYKKDKTVQGYGSVGQWNKPKHSGVVTITLLPVVETQQVDRAPAECVQEGSIKYQNVLEKNHHAI